MKNLSSALSKVGGCLIVLGIINIFIGIFNLSLIFIAISYFVNAVVFIIAGSVMSGISHDVDVDCQKIDNLSARVGMLEQKEYASNNKQTTINNNESVEVKEVVYEIKGNATFKEKEQYVKNMMPETYKTLSEYYGENEEKFKEEIMSFYDSLL